MVLCIMMLSIFLIYSLVTLAAWFGFRRAAIFLFIINLILSVIWFQHHVTESIHMQL